MVKSDSVVDEIALPGLVNYIEHHFNSETLSIDEDGLDHISYFLKERVPLLHPDSQSILLGCTHYSWISDLVAELFPSQDIIDPSVEAATKFVDYLQKHPEIEKKLTKNGIVEYIS